MSRPKQLAVSIVVESALCFTDEQRRHPPPTGSWVTYSYQNLTARGIPRFARFLRARPD